MLFCWDVFGCGRVCDHIRRKHHYDTPKAEMNVIAVEFPSPNMIKYETISYFLYFSQ